MVPLLELCELCEWLHVIVGHLWPVKTENKVQKYMYSPNMAHVVMPGMHSTKALNSMFLFKLL